MGDDKIRISWEEVQDPRIDERLRQQSAQARAAQHYQQQVAQPATAGYAPAVGRGAGPGAIFYNALVYMTLFGLAGGLAAWVAGEGGIFIQLRAHDVAERSANERFDRYQEDLRQELNTAIQQGRMTYDDARARFEAGCTQRAQALGAEIWWRDYFFAFPFFILCGGVIAAFIAVAEPIVERNWPMVAFQGSLGLLAGILGGALVASFVNILYRFLMGGGQVQPSLPIQIMARAIGWVILGMFLSVSAGLVLRSFKKCFCGVAGGLVGGLVGGCLFDAIGRGALAAGVQPLHADVMSRFVGIVAIGTLSGLATGLIENVAKTGWVRVLRGLIAGKQFILYRNPTTVGSSPQCEIYLFKDPAVGPRHAAIHAVRGGFDLEDLQSGMPTYVNGRPVRRQRLRNEDQVQIGSTVFLFQERRQQS